MDANARDIAVGGASHYRFACRHSTMRLQPPFCPGRNPPWRHGSDHRKRIIQHADKLEQEFSVHRVKRVRIERFNLGNGGIGTCR